VTARAVFLALLQPPSPVGDETIYGRWPFRCFPVSRQYRRVRDANERQHEGFPHLSNQWPFGPVRRHRLGSYSRLTVALSILIFDIAYWRPNVSFSAPRTLWPLLCHEFLVNEHNTVFASKRSAICNRCFPGPTRVLDANGISVASAVFAGLRWQADRPRYSVGNNSQHLRTLYCDVVQ